MNREERATLHALEELEAMDALHDRWPATIREIGWMLAGDEAEDRWADRWYQRARTVLGRLERQGRAGCVPRTSRAGAPAGRNRMTWNTGWWASYWYPTDDEEAQAWAQG